MKTLLDLLRDPAWNGVQGLLALAGTFVGLAYWFAARWSKVADWFYDQYYEHIRWRLYGPPPGFDEAAALTVKVVGTSRQRADTPGPAR